MTAEALKALAALDKAIRDHAEATDTLEDDDDNKIGAPNAWVLIVGGMRFSGGEARHGMSITDAHGQASYVTLGMLHAAIEVVAP